MLDVVASSLNNSVRSLNDGPCILITLMAVYLPSSVCLASKLQETAQETSDIDATQEAVSAAPHKENPWQIHLFASEAYRFGYATAPETETFSVDGDTSTVSANAEDIDHELRFFANGSVQSPQDRFFADVSFAFLADVDGTIQDDTITPFGSTYETYNYFAWFDLFSAYAEYRTPGVFSYARVGRQESDHGPLVIFDGAALEIRPARPYLDIFAFGGRTVHFYSVEKTFFEDWIASGGAVIRPHPMLRFELDYRFITEDRSGDDPLEEHSYGVSGFFRYKEHLYLRAYTRGLDKNIAHSGGALNLEWPRVQTGITISIDAQLISLRRINEEEDPYLAILGESLPHMRFNAGVHKDFPTPHGTYSIVAGWNGRIATVDETTVFNRDYGRVFLWLQATDIGIKGPYANATTEYHYTLKSTETENDATLALGGSMGWDWNWLKFEAGTYYQYYKYDYYIDVTEIQDARTVYGECRIVPIDWLSIRLKYDFEVYDRYAHTAMLSLMQRI